MKFFKKARKLHAGIVLRFYCSQGHRMKKMWRYTLRRCWCGRYMSTICTPQHRRTKRPIPDHPRTNPEV